jgi:predicted nucleic acid-binding protein
MAFVLDSSVALAWVLPDESNADADAVFSRLTQERAVVPALWSVEVGNALLMASRRARIETTKVRDLLSVLYSLPIDAEDSPDRDVLLRSLSFAEKHSLTIYDATYLELAVRRKMPIATFDSRLKSACIAAEIAMLV